MLNAKSSGTTLELERFSFTPIKARFVRIVGNSNSSNSWNSITEVRENFTELNTQLECNSSEKRTFIYPNPVKDEIINVNLTNLINKPYIVKIYDLSGKIVWQQNYNLNTNLIQIKNVSLTNGFYVLKINNEELPLIISE